MQKQNRYCGKRITPSFAFWGEITDTAEAAYNLGALYAREGKKEEAMVQLTSAVDHGLSAKLDLELATDTDFKSLHGDALFEALHGPCAGTCGSSETSEIAFSCRICAKKANYAN